MNDQDFLPCMLSEEDFSAIRTLEAVHEGQAASLDFSAMEADFADDIVVMPPNKPAVVGKAGVRDWQRAWEGVSFETYRLTVDEILGCGDLAYVKGTYAMSFSPEGVDEPISDTGRWVHLLRKASDGRWLIIRDIFSSELPLQAG